MKFRIIGSLRETDNETEIIVTASSYRDAESQANSMGISVTDIFPADSSVTPQFSTSVHLAETPKLIYNKSLHTQYNSPNTKVSQMLDKPTTKGCESSAGWLDDRILCKFGDAMLRRFGIRLK